MSKAEFTIVIPTRDRLDTLKYSIETALAINYHNYEVLVVDNYSFPDVASLGNSILDHRVRCIRSERRLSMSENWEYALDHVETEWLTFLGDDDAILPNSLATINNVISATGVSAIRTARADYHWPGLRNRKYGVIEGIDDTGINIINSAQMIRSVLIGDNCYTMLPCIYNGGFVKKELIQKARNMTGPFFLSMTPDIYSGFALALLTDHYAYSNQVSVINGASIHSNGTSQFSTDTSRQAVKPVEAFLSENTITVHSSLPLTRQGKPVRSIQVIVFEAYLQTLPLRQNLSEFTTIQEQIQRLYDNPGKFKAEVLDWIKDVCVLHGLPFPPKRTASERHPHFLGRLHDYVMLYLKRLKIMLLGSKTQSTSRRIVINGNSGYPMSNCYEAMIAWTKKLS